MGMATAKRVHQLFQNKKNVYEFKIWIHVKILFLNHIKLRRQKFENF